MKYKVVKIESRYFDTAISGLNDEVKILLNSGWKLQGGIAIALEPHSDDQICTYFYVAQAMIKED